jgi:hypothetical protein
MLATGRGDMQPFLGVDEVVIVVSTDVSCTQLILPVNRLSLAVSSATTVIPDSWPMSVGLSTSAQRARKLPDCQSAGQCVSQSFARTSTVVIARITTVSNASPQPRTPCR